MTLFDAFSLLIAERARLMRFAPCRQTSYAKRCEAVEDRGADLDLGDLSVEVAR